MQLRAPEWIDRFANEQRTRPKAAGRPSRVDSMEAVAQATDKMPREPRSALSPFCQMAPGVGSERKERAGSGRHPAPGDVHDGA